MHGSGSQLRKNFHVTTKIPSARVLVARMFVVHDQISIALILAPKAKDREERRIPIMPALAKILERRKVGPDGQELTADRYVFGNQVGEPVARRRLCTWWNDTLSAAGVKDLHLHDLRAEAASQSSEAGASDKDVRDALGHSNTSMTSVYLRSRRTSLRDAYAKRARKALRLARVGQSTKQAKSS